MPEKKTTRDKSKELKKVNPIEAGARRGMIEELFYDMYDSRRRIYLINFFRGIFFGFGSVLGGTVLVALLVWILSQFVDWFPIIGDFIQQITESIN